MGDTDRSREQGASRGAKTPLPADPGALTALVSEGDGGARERVATDLQRAVGNRTLQRIVDERLAAPVVGARGGALPMELGRSLEAERGGGRPLSADERRPMERALDTDFEQVRLHEDEAAGELAVALGARAFTVGNDVFLGPRADASADLLAHELTHVAQQRSLNEPPALEVGSADSRHEREAESAGADVASGGALSASALPVPAVQRDWFDFATDDAMGSILGAIPELAAGLPSFSGIADAGKSFLGSPGAALDAAQGAGAGVANTAGNVMGAVLGPLSAYGGLSTIVDEFESGNANVSNLIGGGLSYMGGAASALGGLGSLGVGGSAAGSLASLGPVGALIGAGGGGFAVGTAIGENFIDPYLNRAHTEEIDEEESIAAFEAQQRGETTWQADVNNWLDTW